MYALVGHVNGVYLKHDPHTHGGKSAIVTF